MLVTGILCTTLLSNIYLMRRQDSRFLLKWAMGSRLWEISIVRPSFHPGLWKYHVRPGPISFRTSWKFLFTCPWTSTNVLSKCNSVFHILINYYELTSCIENSVDPDKLASKEASWSGSTIFTREASWSGYILFTELIYIWFHTVFERINCLSTVR